MADPTPSPTEPADADLTAIRARIQHVFVLMLENRSFDHLFALSGIAGIRAATAANANPFNGRSFAFQAGAPESMPTDPGHEFQDVLQQLCGAQAGSFQRGGPYPPMDNSGFVANYATTTTEGAQPQADEVGDVMLGVDTARQTPRLCRLAAEFVLCDAWFSSLPGPTWPNRFFVHGASSGALDASPSDLQIAAWDTVDDGFRFPRGSIFDLLGKENCRLYQDESGPLSGRIPQVAAIRGISFFDVHSLDDFEQDAAGPYPYKYTFIEPSYGDVVSGSYEGGSSQHPRGGLQPGDALVATVYNTLRNSPLWESSLLIVTYDEHGGFYDSVAPGPATPPNDGSDPTQGKNGFDFSVYGVRVPAVVVSPWTGRGVVDPTLYDHSSVPKTLERLFGLPNLTDRDRDARSVLGLIGSVCRPDCLRSL